MSITSIVPQVRTTNLDESIAFYVDTIGFHLYFRYSDFYAGLKLGAYALHLKLVDAPDPSIAYVGSSDHFHLYLETDDAAAEAARLKSRGVRFRQELEDTDWGTREFYVYDDQGHVLCVGQRLAPQD